MSQILAHHMQLLVKPRLHYGKKRKDSGRDGGGSMRCPRVGVRACTSELRAPTPLLLGWVWPGLGEEFAEKEIEEMNGMEWNGKYPSK
jgi:hypothetical protein